MKIAARRFHCVRVPAVLVLLVLMLGFTTLGLAQQNLVYINSNVAVDNQNSVTVLVNDGAGNLSPLAGSPFLTGGTGVGANPNPLIDAQWDSDGEVMINSSGSLLFAVNGHTNSVAAFKIDATGALTPVAGSPFSSGGKQPASIAYMDNGLGGGVSMMVVANKNSDPLDMSGTPSYTTFKVTAGGVLSQFSSLGLPAGTSPAQVLLQPGSSNFFGMEFISARIASYKLNRLGQMTAVGSVSAAAPVVGSVIHPKVKAMYTTIPPAHSVGVFTWDSSGNLFFLRNVNDTGMAVCWAAINAAGTRLYTSETASGTITVFDLTNTKIPVQLQHLAVQGTGPLPTHMKIDPTGKFLYVLDRNGLVHVFDVATDGTIAENHTPYSLGLPAKTVPLGVAVLMK